MTGPPSQQPTSHNHCAEVVSPASSALALSHRGQEGADVVHPQLRLLERREMPAVRHLREVDDVEPRFCDLARCLEVRVGRRRAPVVLVRERPAAGRRGDAAGRRHERRGRQRPAIHVATLEIDPARRRAAVGHPLDHDVGEQLVLRERLLDVAVVVAPVVPLLQHLAAPPPPPPAQGINSLVNGAHNLGYQEIQSTKPQTLGFGLSDSPVGLASWILEKWYNFSNHAGDIEKAFTKDELLTNIMIYWVTNSGTSSSRIYFESRHMNGGPLPASPFVTPTGRVAAPTGCGALPYQYDRRATPPNRCGIRQRRGCRWSSCSGPSICARCYRYKHK